MKIIAIIPARGGSKGVPGKNIYNLNGKPLLHYALDVAVKCDKIDEVWVSSDDEEILKVAKEYRDVNLHKRSSTIANDNSSVIDTIFAVLECAKKEFDAILILQPTSPLRTVKNLEEAISKMELSNDCNSVISVCEMDDVHPARMYWNNSDILEPIMPEFEQVRRQDIPPALYRNGCIYLVRKNALVQHNQVMVKPVTPYVMPTNWLLNIDEPRDIIIAQALIPAWENGLI